MKAYIGNVNWADEGFIFFLSIASEEKLEALKELLSLCEELGLFPERGIEMYWGTNEFFYFNPKKLKKFIDEAVDISEEDMKVFEKFGVSGFDIYDNMGNSLGDLICGYDFTLRRYTIKSDLTAEDLSRIKEPYIKLFGPDEWNRILKPSNTDE
ncbi:hypothetical protein [Intestinibacter sp.]|uniref:hypothetical protein n=1 Tax=Intestinibacter sp. TaxID=1965304 RepID=UPI003F17A99D